MYVLIENNIVVATSKHSMLSDNVIQTEETPKVGDLYEDGNFFYNLHVMKEKKRAVIQEEKKRVRDSGVVVNDILFDTDGGARMEYNSFALEIMNDPEYTVENWKASSGEYVTMNGELFQQLKVTGGSLLLNVTSWQKQRDALVDAAQTIEDIEAINTNYNGS